ncbi:MAG: HepT-like ribonuclease domain-containing protein [Terriglobia bacterium]
MQPEANVLAHEYGEADDSLVWRVATSRISELISQIEPIVPPLP